MNNDLIKDLKKTVEKFKRYNGVDGDIKTKVIDSIYLNESKFGLELIFTLEIQYEDLLTKALKSFLVRETVIEFETWDFDTKESKESKIQRFEVLRECYINELNEYSIIESNYV